MNITIYKLDFLARTLLSLRIKSLKMKALKCKPSAQFAYNSINVLSKCSNNFTSIIFEGRHQSLKVATSIFEGCHINLRRSTHQSSKVNIDLQRLTPIFESRHQSSKIDTSIFKGRRRKHRTDNSSPNIVHNGAPIVFYPKDFIMLY